MSKLPTFHALVLSAGFGTRLKPLTLEIPKPLLPVGNTPTVGTHLIALRRWGAQRLMVNVHYRSDEIINYINGLQFDVHVSHEVEILGTAGGIARIRALASGAPLVVVNGDIWGEIPLMKLLATPFDGLKMALVPCPLGQGTVGVDAAGHVVRLRGEVFGTELQSGNFMGVSCLGSACLETLPATGCLIGDWALPELRGGGVVRTVFVEGEFIDIGTPENYWLANQRWLASQAHDGSTTCSIGEGAELDDAVLVRSSIIGASCRVLGEGVVEDCILLPGADVKAPLCRVIVTPAGVVVPVRDQ